MKINKVGIAGSGAMGAGIAQVALLAGHTVVLYDKDESMLSKALDSVKKGLSKLVEKSKLSEDRCISLLENLSTSRHTEVFSDSDLVIEAIVENIDAKQELFKNIESAARPDCILVSNTSSISIASLAAACKRPERFAGLHFFNPAALMPLVEIIPGLLTNENIPVTLIKLMTDWGKSPVLAKDTPGFIVNRVARPFYGEAIRIYEEGLAKMEEIDEAMRQLGGFKMGPFELMDFIGNDVNYRVTELVWEQFFYDQKYKPSLTQKRLFESGLYGRKSGRGYYQYTDGQNPPSVQINESKAKEIFNRIIAMLINEAVEAYYLGIASKEDLDTAMVKGVNYKKGLLTWCDDLGAGVVHKTLQNLYEIYGEDRYRSSVLLRKMAQEGSRFYT